MFFEVTVTKKRKEAHEYESLFFTKPEGFIYKPGGIFDLYFLDKPSLKRVFSFASSPTEKELMIGYRTGVSDFKKRLQALKIGDTVGIRYIGSTLAPLEKKNLFIAGGIGITTFRSMLIYLEDTEAFVRSTLIYINRSDEFPYTNDLQKVAQVNAFDIKYINTKRHGRLTPEKVEPFIEEVKNKERVVYISGPPSMVDHTIHLFESLGVDRNILQSDSFDGYNESFDIS